MTFTDILAIVVTVVMIGTPVLILLVKVAREVGWLITILMVGLVVGLSSLFVWGISTTLNLFFAGAF